MIWIPALVGRAGGRLIAASIALAVLFGIQYAFVESDESTIQALHPLNGALLFALALWIARRAFVLVRRTSRSRDNAPGEGGVARDGVARDDRPGRGS